MKNIKAVFFDADDTLLDHIACEKYALAEMFQKIGVNYKHSYRDVFRDIEIELWDNSTMPRENIFVHRFARLFETLNIPYLQAGKANEYYCEALSQAGFSLEHSENVVKCIQEKGILICVVTNGLDAMQRSRISNSTFGRYISHIVTSEEVGIPKPNPLIFEVLLKKINLTAKDVLMVGDSLQNDILGAKNAGIQSVWYNPNRIHNETDISPDYEIHDLRELLTLLCVFASGNTP